MINLKKRKIIEKTNRKQKEFHLSRKYIIIGIIFIILVLGYFLISKFNLFNIKSLISQDDFYADSILLKLSIPVGGESAEYFNLINYKEGKNFKISFENLDDLASVDGSEFFLDKGESKIVQISFKDNSYQTNVLVGSLIIETSSSIKKIPIILGIEDKTPTFAITQKPLPNYLEVYPGEKIGMDIKIFNLKNNDLHNLKTNYIIKNFYGDLVLSEQESFVIKDTFSTIKMFDIPKDVKTGNYVFITLVEYNNTKSFSANLFEISDKGFDINLGKFNITNPSII